MRGVFTNKAVPMDAYRGAGRPEANYVLERLIDRAAAELKIDAAELRALNLPASQTAMFRAVTGLPIDGGQFLDNQRLCLERADRTGFEARRASAAAHGRLRGFGFANYLRVNGGTPGRRSDHARRPRPRMRRHEVRVGRIPSASRSVRNRPTSTPAR